MCSVTLAERERNEHRETMRRVQEADDAAYGREYVRQCIAEYKAEGRKLFAAGEPIEACWNAEQRQGYQAAEREHNEAETRVERLFWEMRAATRALCRAVVA